MQCDNCNRWNPDERTVCQYCGQSTRKLTGGDLAGGIFGAALGFFAPSNVLVPLGDKLIRNKVAKIEADILKAMREILEGRYQNAVKLVQGTGVTDTEFYPPDYRAWRHYLLGAAYRGLHDERRATDHLAQLTAVSGTSERFQSEEARRFRSMLLQVVSR